MLYLYYYYVILYYYILFTVVSRSAPLAYPSKSVLEDRAVRERTGQAPKYPEAKKTTWLTHYRTYIQRLASETAAILLTMTMIYMNALGLALPQYGSGGFFWIRKDHSEIKGQR